MNLRWVIFGIAASVCVGCSGDRNVFGPKLDLICIEKFVSADGGSRYARNIGVSVDGRVAYAEFRHDWFWADTREPVGDALDQQLYEFTEAHYPTYYRTEPKPSVGPEIPPCVLAELERPHA